MGEEDGGGTSKGEDEAVVRLLVRHHGLGHGGDWDQWRAGSVRRAVQWPGMMARLRGSRGAGLRRRFIETSKNDLYRLLGLGELVGAASPRGARSRSRHKCGGRPTSKLETSIV
jgi:hypothetical protein